jgi:hypothetical protein
MNTTRTLYWLTLVALFAACSSSGGAGKPDAAGDTSRGDTADTLPSSPDSNEVGADLAQDVAPDRSVGQDVGRDLAGDFPPERVDTPLAEAGKELLAEVASGAGNETGGIGPDPRVGEAFDISVPSGSSWCVGACQPATALVTGLANGNLQLVWGRTGHATVLSLSSTNGTFTLGSPVVLGEKNTWQYARCTDTSTLTSATFTFAGEGTNRTLSIAGRVTAVQCSDDYTMSSDWDASLSGKADHRTPIAYGPGANADPYAGLSINLDKPMAADSTVTVTPSGGPSFTMAARTEAGYVVGFDSDMIMPAGQSFHARFSGLDLAGIGTPSDIEWSSLSDFGVLATDGFESGSTSGISGGTVVDSYGVPAISGQKMLRVAPGVSTLLHLAAVPGAQRVLLDIRVLNECSAGATPSQVSIAVKVGVMGSGGAEVTTVSTGSTTSATVGTGSIGVGQLTSLTLPLPTGAGDVLVQLLGAGYLGAGCMRVGALVDNVRLE